MDPKRNPAHTNRIGRHNINNNPQPMPCASGRVEDAVGAHQELAVSSVEIERFGDLGPKVGRSQKKNNMPQLLWRHHFCGNAIASIIRVAVHVAKDYVGEAECWELSGISQIPDHRQIADFDI